MIWWARKTKLSYLSGNWRRAKVPWAFTRCRKSSKWAVKNQYPMIVRSLALLKLYTTKFIICPTMIKKSPYLMNLMTLGIKSKDRCFISKLKSLGSRLVIPRTPMVGLNGFWSWTTFQIRSKRRTNGLKSYGRRKLRIHSRRTSKLRLAPRSVWSKISIWT